MAVPPAPRVGSVTQEQGSPEDGTSGAPSSRGFRVGLLLALVLVLVGSLAWTGYLVATRTSGAGGNLPERVGSLLSGENTIAAERERVMDVASQFMLRVNSYGPDDLAEDGTMPDYRERVGELITPAFRADFETQVGTAEQTVAQAQLGRECEVYGVGVSTMDADSATALVAGVFTNSYPGNGRRADERVESEPASFRVRISLVKVAGEWLVDDFAPVTGAGVTLDPSAAPGEPGAPGTDPAVPPTDEAPEEQQ